MQNTPLENNSSERDLSSQSGPSGADEDLEDLNISLTSAKDEALKFTHSSKSGPSKRKPIQVEPDRALKLIDLPTAVPDDHWALVEARRKAEEIEQAIIAAATKAGLPEIEKIDVMQNGSMACGHFTGMKPVEHSVNYRHLLDENGKPRYDHVVEVDLRVVVPESWDLLDKKVQAVVLEALGGDEHVDNVEETIGMKRWDQEMDMVSFFQYKDVAPTQTGERIGIEYEVCLNNSPYVEIAEVWKDVFDDYEIDWQVKHRESLRTLMVPYEEEYIPAKKLQCMDCRWRILASYAVSRLFAEGKVDLGYEPKAEDLPPFQGEPPASIEWLVEAWLDGEAGYSDSITALDRPSFFFPGETEEKLKAAAEIIRRVHTDQEADEVLEILEPPAPPRWVQIATAIQETIRAGKRSKLN